jgi:precorrin-6A/cobalt-precorrin-6A reductase
VILLLGGCAESPQLARMLVEHGYSVLFSKMTNLSLSGEGGTGVTVRMGPLDLAGMVALVRDQKIQTVVDATHPYAEQARQTAREASRMCGIPCFRFTRKVTEGLGDALRVRTHAEAARLAFSFGEPVLLTVGTRNIDVYANEWRRSRIPIFVRILPVPESIEACRVAGFPEVNILAAKGPFSVEANRATIQRHGIRVLVTKDGGVAGGMPEKMEAARLESCRVVLIERPFSPDAGYVSMRDLVQALLAQVPPTRE